MTDPRVQGPLSAIAVPIAEGLAQHGALPPFQKNIGRASFGAGLLTLCGYTAVTLGPVARTFPPYYLLVWAGLAGFGPLLLIVGVHGARGPRDIMHAFWAVAVPAGCGWALWYFDYLYLLDDFYVRGGALALVAGAVVRVWLALRGMPGDAQRNVRQYIEQNTSVWRSARPRR